jgi:hypothetical protein
MKSHKLLLAAAVTVGLAGSTIIGCGGDDDDKVKCGDGGCLDASSDATADATTTYGISSTGLLHGPVGVERARTSASSRSRPRWGTSYPRHLRSHDGRAVAGQACWQPDAAVARPGSGHV